MPRLGGAFLGFLRMKKATTKIMVTDFILPLTVHAVEEAFVFHEASAVGSLLDLSFMTTIPVMLLDFY